MKKWYKVKSTPSGTTVTVSLQDGNLSASSTVKAFVSEVAAGVSQAEKNAHRMMDDLKKAVGEEAA